MAAAPSQTPKHTNTIFLSLPKNKPTLARKSQTIAGGTKKEQTGKVTPLMQQYFKMKAKHPDAILLFRVGDFYETFAEDAVKASKALGITLTSRNNGGSDIELAGFPYHSMDVYLPRLVRSGYRVAVCEQLEKPSPEKKIVKRGVTEIVTPGVTTDEKLLDHKTNNFLAAGGRGFHRHFNRRIPRFRR
jgi:DNA mismatch repair protein MutS